MNLSTHRLTPDLIKEFWMKQLIVPREELIMMYHKNQWLLAIPSHGFTEDQINKASESDDGFLGYLNGVKCYVHIYIEDEESSKI